MRRGGSKMPIQTLFTAFLIIFLIFFILCIIIWIILVPTGLLAHATKRYEYKKEDEDKDQVKEFLNQKF